MSLWPQNRDVMVDRRDVVVKSVTEAMAMALPLILTNFDEALRDDTVANCHRNVTPLDGHLLAGNAQAPQRVVLKHLNSVRPRVILALDGNAPAVNCLVRALCQETKPLELRLVRVRVVEDDTVTEHADCATGPRK